MTMPRFFSGFDIVYRGQPKVDNVPPKIDKFPPKIIIHSQLDNAFQSCNARILRSRSPHPSLIAWPKPVLSKRHNFIWIFLRIVISYEPDGAGLSPWRRLQALLHIGKAPFGDCN